MAFDVGFCRICGEELDDSRRRYCEDHAEEAGREANRLRQARRRSRNGGLDPGEVVLGTGNLIEHRDPDFRREAVLVHDELIRLGLRKRRRPKA